MKLFKFLASTMLVAGIFAACNKEDNDLIQSATEEARVLATMYPNAQNVRWEKEGEFNVAEFTNNGIKSEAWFMRSVWQYTEADISYDALPQRVKAAFKASEYANWKVEDVDMVERNGTEVFYVIEVEKGEQEVDLYYMSNGKLIKTVKAPHTVLPGQYANPTIPAGVLNSIKAYIAANYPNATILEYEIEDGYIEVDILDGTVHRVLVFTLQGEWVNSHVDDGDDDYDYDDDAYEGRHRVGSWATGIRIRGERSRARWFAGERSSAPGTGHQAAPGGGDDRFHGPAHPRGAARLLAASPVPAQGPVRAHG